MTDTLVSMTVPTRERTTMKIKVSFTVEVDETAWRDEYGVEDVRADVKTYIENAANDHLTSLGLAVYR